MVWYVFAVLCLSHQLSRHGCLDSRKLKHEVKLTLWSMDTVIYVISHSVQLECLRQRSALGLLTQLEGGVTQSLAIDTVRKLEVKVSRELRNMHESEDGRT